MHYLLIIALINIAMLVSPLTVQAEKRDSTDKILITSKAPTTSPIIDYPNRPPKPPSGPLWMPTQGEKYRLDLEQYRLDLESRRKSSPINNVNQYLRGVEQYRNGIKLYRENIQTTPLINQLQQNDNKIPGAQ